MKRSVLMALLMVGGMVLVGWIGGWQARERVRSVGFQAVARGTAATVGTEVVGVVVPSWLSGWQLTGGDFRCYTAGVGTGTTDIRIKKRSTAGSDSTMYSATVKTGVVEATETRTVANCRVTTGDLVVVDVTQVHGTTAPYGVWGTLAFEP